MISIICCHFNRFIDSTSGKEKKETLSMFPVQPVWQLFLISLHIQYQKLLLIITHCALELAPKKIRIDSINSAIKTSSIFDAMDMTSDEVGQLFEQMRRNHPFGRLSEVSALWKESLIKQVNHHHF